MRQNGYNIHIAKEAPDFTYSLDNNSFMLRSSRIWFWPYFGRSWPGYSLYKQNARFPIGKILQHRAFAVMLRWIYLSKLSIRCSYSCSGLSSTGRNGALQMPRHEGRRSFG